MIAGLREREREREHERVMRLPTHRASCSSWLFCTSHFTQDQRNASDFLYKLRGIIFPLALVISSAPTSNLRIPDLMGLYLM